MSLAVELQKNNQTETAADTEGTEATDVGSLRRFASAVAGSRIGVIEIIAVFVLALVLFGPRQFPRL